MRHDRKARPEQVRAGLQHGEGGEVHRVERHHAPPGGDRGEERVRRDHELQRTREERRPEPEERRRDHGGDAHREERNEIARSEVTAIVHELAQPGFDLLVSLIVAVDRLALERQPRRRRRGDPGRGGDGDGIVPRRGDRAQKRAAVSKEESE